jgi:DNA-binding MarR family transcriptional regulator
MTHAKNFNYLLMHVAEVMDKQFDQLLHKQLGIGVSQYRLLMVLDQSPYLQQRGIAEMLGQSEAGISRQIRNLEKYNLIVSRRDPMNKRRCLNSLTPIGTRVTIDANRLVRESLISRTAGMEDEWPLRLNQDLRKLHQIICYPGKIGACDHQLDNI